MIGFRVVGSCDSIISREPEDCAVTTVRASILTIIIAFVAPHVFAECSGQPHIPNLRISHAVTSYTLTWDPPAGVASPVYEIMQTTQSEYCPFQQDRSVYNVVGTTSATTFTASKSTPDSAV